MEGPTKYVLIFLLCGILSIQFLLIPVEWRIIDSSIMNCCLYAMIGIVAVLLTFQRKLVLPMHLISGLIVTILLLNLSSGIWAIHTSLIWPSVIAWTMYLMLYLFAFSLPREILESRFLRVFVLGIITFNLGSIFLGYLSSLIEHGWSLTLSQIEDVPKIYRLNTNFLGSLFLLYVPILLSIKYQGWLKWLALGNVFFIVTLLPLLNSRATTLALGLLVVYYLWRSFKNGNVLRYMRNLGIVAIAIFLSYQSFISNKSNFTRTYNYTRTIVDNTGDDRVEIWRNTLKLFTEKPLLGHGAGNWLTEIYKYGYNDYKYGVSVGHAHSYWMETLSELGLIGLILMVVLGICVLVLSVKTGHWHLLGLLLGLATLCTFYGIYQARLSDSSSYLLLLFIWLGAVLRESKVVSLNNSLLSIVLCLMTGFSIFLSYSQVRLENHLNEWNAVTKENFDDKLQDWDKYDMGYAPKFRRGKTILLFKANALWRFGKKHASVKVLEEAVSVNPYNRQIWLVLGNRYSQLKKYHKAAVCYENVLDLYHGEDDAYLGLCQIGLKLNNTRYFQKGIQGYYERALPAFESNYDDDYLTWDVPRIVKYWTDQCRDIDLYQSYLYQWQTKQLQESR